jgi:hypothetical protein
MMIISRIAALALALGLGLSAHPLQAAEPAKSLEIPVLVTSSGQALDAFTVKTLLARAGVANEYDPVASAQKLEGKKTLIIVPGASIKGFGAAGITAETELTRTRSLLDVARAQGTAIVVVHTGGSDRRGGASEQFIQLVAPAADRLVVVKEGDADGYFSKQASQRSVPLRLVDRPLDVGPALAKEFGDATKL